MTADTRPQNALPQDALPQDALPAAPAAETLLTRAEASAFLQAKGIRMKPTTLARAYSTGSGGPPCRHIRNKPFYPLALLDVWAESQITAPVASSSERQRLRREARRQEAGHGS